jgi:hypothetical protein
MSANLRKEIYKPAPETRSNDAYQLKAATWLL